MDMDGDEGLVFGPLDGLEVSCGGVDEQVQEFQELVVHVIHDATILPSLHQGDLGISGPDHLQSE